MGDSPSPQDVYATCLPNNRGYPLWFPEPSSTLPSSYREDGLQIGDVGCVTPKGSFDVLFNVCFGPNHDLHQRRGFSFPLSPVQLDLEHDVEINLNADPPDCIITSDGIARPIQTPPGAGHHEFIPSSAKGAILILPDGAMSQELVLRANEHFRRVAMERALDWYKFASEYYGPNIDSDSLYLLTGFYKARSWSLASFRDDPTAGPRRVRVVPREDEGTIVGRTWRPTFPLHFRDGPGVGHNGMKNQSVFISGFKIAVREGWLSLSPSVHRVPASAAHEGKTGPEKWWPWTNGNTSVSRVPQSSQPFHPSNNINRYLLNKDPDALVAITHDSEWITLLETGKTTVEELSHGDCLEKSLSENYSLISQPQNRAVYLQRKSMFPPPRDLLPIFYCPLCPPASVLSAPTTLRCGHTICAVHVHSSLCPIPDCSIQHQSFTPNIPSSRVAFFPAPLSTQDLHSDPSRALDVRVNDIIHLLQAANAAQDRRFPNPLDDVYDSDDSLPSPDLSLSRHRHNSDPSPLLPTFHSFKKSLSTELTCEICFMLLYQPVTTPCQHTFCSKCLQRSLDHSMSCPLCRQEFPGFAYFQEHPHNKIILSLLLRAFPNDYSARGAAIAREERDSRLDTPIFVCQLSFPGIPTLLHFFEPRYRLMLRRCLETPCPTFGMVMPPRAAPTSGHGTNAGSEFGIMLEIKSVQILADGRSMVETCGTHRFRILEYGFLDGYMIGRVENIDDYDDDLAQWAAENDAHTPSASDATRVDIWPPPQSLTQITPPISSLSAPSTTHFQDSTLSRTSQHFLSTASLLAICHSFLAQLRAGTAPWVVQRLNSTYGPQPPDTDPSLFSFWMGMILPIDEHEKAKLLPVKSAYLRLRMVVGWIKQLDNNWWFTSGCTVL